MELFKQKISSLVCIGKSEEEAILSAFNCSKIAKGDTLIKQGSFCNHYYFLEKGLLRFVYHISEKEETSWVLFEGTFFSELISLKTRNPTNMSLEALEPAVVLSIHESALEKLCNDIRPMEKYLRLTWEENLYNLLEMKLLHQFRTARERYELLIKDERFMQRISQKDLASILGITPYSLSRLRNPRKK